MQGIRRMKGAAVAAVALVVLVALTGCNFTGSDTGTLVISLSSRLTARTIQPELSMGVAEYEVTFSGPSAVDPVLAGADETTVVQPSLVPGEWTITVNAYNSPGVDGGDLIGTGTETVTILAGQLASLAITVTPIVGDGVLDVTVSWPVNVLTSPILNATLVPFGETYNASTDQLTVSSATSADGLRTVASLGGVFPSGYYTLSLQLLDGGSDAVWGTVEAVRIIAAETSAQDFVLTEQTNRAGLELSIATDLDNPFDITLSDVTVADADLGTFTATASVASPLSVSWSWYLQGAPIADGVGGATIVGDTSTSTVTFDPDTAGYYTLTVVADDGDVLSSNYVEFEVQ